MRSIFRPILHEIIIFLFSAEFYRLHLYLLVFSISWNTFVRLLRLTKSTQMNTIIATNAVLAAHNAVLTLPSKIWSWKIRKLINSKEKYPSNNHSLIFNTAMYLPLSSKFSVYWNDFAVVFILTVSSILSGYVSSVDKESVGLWVGAILVKSLLGDKVVKPGLQN